MSDPILLHPNDNVVVLTTRGNIGDDPLNCGNTLQNIIPTGHKIARCDIPKGEHILKFGQFIAIATQDIATGQHVHVHNCQFAQTAQDYEIGADLDIANAAVPAPTGATFNGYARADGQVGTRNYIALIATVNCSATVIRKAAFELESSGMLDRYENVDGVVAFAHGSGCGMASDGRGFDILDRVLWGHATHPNVGATIFVGLGCEVMQIARMQTKFGKTGGERFRALTIQESGGTRTTIDQIKAHVCEILPDVNTAKRSKQSMSKLRVALQCGGSDGFSSITANPALGIASDLIVAEGGAAILSETPEIYGAEQLFLRRAASNDVAQQLISQIKWWETYAAQNGGSMDNNPSPGNKQGGITTILEKSLGAAAKAGSTPLTAVYDYAEKISGAGFVFMDTPGYDPVSVTGQIAGGAQIVVFTTGRGSAFGSKPAPTIKLATSDRLFAQMHDDMDLNAGDVISNGVSIHDKGREIFDAIRATASGQLTKSEMLGLGDNEFVPWPIGAVM
ncbi:galactonate dehydratase [Amylibacter kogurei]|uniref:Galactonate dehydratase n=1 Tax=Paramylibacter kogurei TaxID=1889778 RepID=A0A2G5K5F4_9RHOB|nr:altronate dehydratase family protein [Amylibacter kogurei]PIB24751.1 galactonate dehydratase [Amylibacter kogurei]